jgi:hypothetical protein
MPFHEYSNVQVISAYWSKQRPTLEGCFGDIRENVELIRCCWSEDPLDRPNASNIVNHLEFSEVRLFVIMSAFLAIDDTFQAVTIAFGRTEAQYSRPVFLRAQFIRLCDENPISVSGSSRLLKGAYTYNVSSASPIAQTVSHQTYFSHSQSHGLLKVVVKLPRLEKVRKPNEDLKLLLEVGVLVVIIWEKPTLLKTRTSSTRLASGRIYIIQMLRHCLAFGLIQREILALLPLRASRDLL